MRRCFFALCFLFAATPAVRADSAPHWIEVQSDHFIVVTDTDEGQGRRIAAQFERMRALFQTVLPHTGGDAGLPITVLALKNRKGFQALVPAAYLAKGSIQLDGLFLRTEDRNYILLRLDAESEHPFSVVYHEYTHFVLRKAEWLPLWLNEGLAEFYQNTDIGDKDVHLGQPSVDNILYLRENRLLPLQVLLAVDHNSPYYHDEQKGSVFYAESWALTHYIEITDFEHKTSRLQDYARLLAKHEDPVGAAQQVFGDLGLLQKQLNSYVESGQYKAFLMKIAFTADPTKFRARSISESDANALRADVLAHDDRIPEAHTLLDAVLRDDPKNALAHETMGSLAYRDHNLAAAEKWYGEAVQLDSKSYLAYFHFANLNLMRGSSGSEDSIESSLRQCIRLEPTFAPAYDALAQFYAMHHEKLEEAHMLMLHAVQLEPEETRYRLNSANILMQQGQVDSALAVLRAAEATTTDASTTSNIENHIHQAEQFKAASTRGFTTTRNLEGGSTVTAGVSAPAEPEHPAYPAGPPTGPLRTAKGTLHAVHCSYPTVLALEVVSPGKTVTLYSNNYFKVAFSTINYVATGDIDPCKAIEGMKASVDYAEVTDKQVAGQIVSIQLSK